MKLIFYTHIQHTNTNRFTEFGANRTEEVRIIGGTRGQVTDARVVWPQYSSSPRCHTQPIFAVWTHDTIANMLSKFGGN